MKVMRITIRVKSIEWGDNITGYVWSDGTSMYKGVDGAVRYELRFYRTEQEMADLKARGGIEIANPYCEDMFIQPFSSKGLEYLDDGRGRKRPVWAWDGNRETLTLSPSYLVDCSPQWKIHLYFTNGKINLLEDSTVTLET
jgi:hypothetical protein